MIVKVEHQDAEILTQIALESKAYWGYTNDQIESWREDLTITSERISNWEFYKFIIDDKIVGFSGISFVTEEQSVLEFLFISPEFMGRKIGLQLLDHAVHRAKQKKCTSMIVLSDPNAQSFYEKYGFVKFKEEQSSIPGRYLPWLRKKLEPISSNELDLIK